MSSLSEYDLDNEVRMVMTMLQGSLSVGYVMGDEQFYPNRNEVYDYTPDWTNLMDIASAIRDGTDGTASMFKFLQNEGDLVLHNSDLTKHNQDDNGRIFAKIECEILRNEDFDCYVTPAKGTVFRLARMRKSMTRINYPLNVIFVPPAGYPACSEYEKVEYLSYKESVAHACREVGFRLEERECAWSEISELVGKGKAYFSSNGHLIHNYKMNAVGIELNPNVAVSLNMSIVDFEETPDSINIKYVKNNRTYTYPYKRVPSVYRYHASDICFDRQEFTNMHLNLFNVVRSYPICTLSTVNLTADLRFGHAPNIIVVPRIMSVRTFTHASVNYVVALDDFGGVCDLISPAYELSTRTQILKTMGITRINYTEGPFSILSTIASVWLNFTDQGASVERVTYTSKMCDFPSQWFFNGQKWDIRAYPLAVRMSRDDDGKAFDVDGRSLSYDPNGEYYHNEGTNLFSIVPDSEYYDKNTLLCNHIPGRFFVNGFTTIIYDLSPVGEPMLNVKSPAYTRTDRSVTIKLTRMGTPPKRKKKKLCYVSVSKTTIKLLSTATKVVEVADTVIASFMDMKKSETFYLENLELFKGSMWYGTFNRGYNFVDPRWADRILVPYANMFSNNYLFSTPLTMRQIFDNSHTYDSVGNYYIDRTLDPDYEVFDEFDDTRLSGDDDEKVEKSSLPRTFTPIMSDEYEKEGIPLKDFIGPHKKQGYGRSRKDGLEITREFPKGSSSIKECKKNFSQEGY